MLVKTKLLVKYVTLYLCQCTRQYLSSITYYSFVLMYLLGKIYFYHLLCRWIPYFTFNVDITMAECNAFCQQLIMFSERLNTFFIMIMITSLLYTNNTINICCSAYRCIFSKRCPPSCPKSRIFRIRVAGDAESTTPESSAPWRSEIYDECFVTCVFMLNLYCVSS